MFDYFVGLVLKELRKTLLENKNDITFAKPFIRCTSIETLSTPVLNINNASDKNSLQFRGALARCNL